MTISAYQRHIKAERKACKRHGLRIAVGMVECWTPDGYPERPFEVCGTCGRESCGCPATFRDALELADLASEFINPLTKSEADYDPFAA